MEGLEQTARGRGREWGMEEGRGGGRGVGSVTKRDREKDRRERKSGSWLVNIKKSKRGKSHSQRLLGTKSWYILYF